MLTRFIYALSALTVSASFAAGQATDAPKPPTAIDFTVGGVGIGTSLDEFHGNLPTAVAGRAPDWGPMKDDHLVVVNNGASQVPTAYFRFLHGRVSTIEIHFPAFGIDEVEDKKPIIGQLTDRFGAYDKPLRTNVLNATQFYTWSTDARYMYFATHEDGTATLFLSSNPVPEIYPPKTPKTTLLGIDPPITPSNGG